MRRLPRCTQQERLSTRQSRSTVGLTLKIGGSPRCVKHRNPGDMHSANAYSSPTLGIPNNVEDTRLLARARCGVRAAHHAPR